MQYDGATSAKYHNPLGAESYAISCFNNITFGAK